MVSPILQFKVLGTKLSPLVLIIFSVFEGSLLSFEQENKELGYVGKPTRVDAKLLKEIIKEDFIPVIIPMGLDEKGIAYNINADTAAGAIARSIKSRRLMLLTDIDGVLDNNDKLISEINTMEANELINNEIDINFIMLVP